MKDNELLSEGSLKGLFEKFDGCEGDVLEYLRSNCKETTNSDIQGAVDGYEASHAIANLHNLSASQEEEEEAFNEAYRSGVKTAERYVKAHEGKPLSRIEQARMNGYRQRLEYNRVCGN